MYSVENFYFVLYNNLLEPCNINPGYFIPFGSTDPNHLIYPTPKFEPFGTLEQVSSYKRCIFWDQEPIFEQTFDSVATTQTHVPIFFSHNYYKILANSEHSDVKNKICKEYKFLDFYYFYHGFAALDWFRDYRYLNKTNTFDKVFITLNRLCTQERSYRLTLVSLLSEKKLIEYGTVSLHYVNETDDILKTELADFNSLLSKNSKRLIYNELYKRNKNFIADSDTVLGSASAGFDSSLLTTALWHIVTETVFYHEKLHLTEKIFKPIVNRRPFILVGAPGNLEYLRSYGFKTFDKWIDESYDNEKDHDKRLLKIVSEVEKLCKLSTEELSEMYEEMTEILDYNFNYFYGDFLKIITDELIENFKGTVRRWNNGRVDQIIDMSPLNFDQIKQRLST